MPHPRQNPNVSDPAHILRNDQCPQCEQLLGVLNVAFHDVHNFILCHYADRAENDGYLGELGRLIHAQVVARRDLVRHQQKHA